MKHDDVQAALRFVASLGLSLDDLASGQADRARVPTISQYIQRLTIKKPEGSSHYRSYWPIIETEWGERLLDSLTVAEIEGVAAQHRRRAATRANSKGGHGAEANFIAALRFLYQNAETDGLIRPDANPAVKARRTSQASGPARPLSLDQIRDLGRVASTTGDDTELDALILRLHIETACRRNSVLTLAIEDLERDDCLVKLHEGGGAIRWQPISPTLMHRLLDHVRNRGGRNVTERVLRYRDGAPVALARYQYLVRRFRDELSWAEELQVNMDWIGRTTEEFVKNQFGRSAANLFKRGHRHLDGAEGHERYDARRLATVAEVLVALTGEPHPLARL
ncbi:hypothetical protein [Nocardia asiatica]|uniref:hypothetical protein n=1 Tax=Nocardia asiatica TaxID=209252 RepID=UPI003EE3A8EE